MMTKRLMALACVLIMVCMAFAGVAVAQGGAGTEENGTTGVEVKPLKDKINLETGTTLKFGGGDYIYVKFGDTLAPDAFFGIVYGTDANPNSLVIVVSHQRFLGTAKVSDENGASMGKNVLIPIWTVVTQKLEDIFEFNDTNADGKCNYLRTGPGWSYSDYYLHEPIYKRVDLTGTWVPSEVKEDKNQTEGWRSWEISFTAKNKKYAAVGDSPSITDDVKNEVLEKIQFTYHLQARFVEVNGVQVPEYKVQVRKQTESGSGSGNQNRNRYEIMSSEKLGMREVSGKRATYDIKSDHLIEGWDFDPTNGQNPGLLLEWHAVVGHYIPPKTVEWLNEQFVRDAGAEGKVTMTTENGTENVDETSSGDAGTVPLKPPRKMKDPFITIGGGWERVGKLTWASNVTVDGEQDTMYAQVQGGVKITIKGSEDGVYKGFAILGGFSYPGGESIFHDPGIASAVMVDMEAPSAEVPIVFLGKAGRGLFLLMVIVGVVAVGGVALKLRGSGNGDKKEERYYDSSYDRRAHEEAKARRPGKGGDEAEDDWDEYYTERR